MLIVASGKQKFENVFQIEKEIDSHRIKYLHITGRTIASRTAGDGGTQLLKFCSVMRLKTGFG
jgi:hypothetical protein